MARSDRPTSSSSQDQRARHVLPSLRDAVGQALHAQRPPLNPQIDPQSRIAEFFVPGISTIYLDDLPIRTYTIGGLRYNMAQPRNETKSDFAQDCRWKDNYLLPRGGSAARESQSLRLRSTQDRRPVDPPPVIQLRVFNGKVDITSIYDATFMLYASLEVARPIAAGKMHTPPSIPVLSGVAVASAAYLEKPTPAAYFIFPDLSVRHEGWYRLKFSLFEGIKHQCDADVENPFIRTSQGSEDGGSAPVRHECMANRLEVQTVPFQVYSAKKFPGLSSSTALSKTVSEQGCRVRIRRDIRQRKRPQKPEPELDDSRSSYHGTPQIAFRNMEHSRSVSRNSFGSQHEAEDARRASVDSMYSRGPMSSRHSSIVSIPMASPSLPSLAPTMSMPPPPPSFNQYSPSRTVPDTTAPAPSQIPSLAPRLPQPTSSPDSHTLPSIRTELLSNKDESLTLPPLRMDGVNGKSFRQWPNVPPAASTKRSRSTYDYASSNTIKSGARPDPVSANMYATPLPSANDIIEADPDMDGTEQDEYEGPLNDDMARFERADGSMAMVTRPRFFLNPATPSRGGLAGRST
ncbi:hypothetical protein PV08_02572 [Exophiala spinifera]|uniref:Velvet domain-containing protein n=1 Tax=Exophiala spinifera TaxID=91928 RepID=A0A0D2C3R1_9EURO|nr:uncharacterized protein PV08_02572 [Exophiala spinifera]KIW18284.1 hypothetical protein PV08_02572 [Exophiala spinifera]